MTTIFRPPLPHLPYGSLTFMVIGTVTGMKPAPLVVLRVSPVISPVSVSKAAVT